MIAIEDETILHITRGDATGTKHNVLAVEYPIYNFGTKQEELYEFKPTDKITFTCFDKKGYTRPEILKKEYLVKDLGHIIPVKHIEIPLTAEDTKKFPLTNKPKTYWYDIVLNDTETILGYDDEGAKKIIVYPEAEEE